MKNKLLWIVTLLPALITAVVIQFMDDQVPMHYNGAGEIDRWGSKYENFIFPVMIVLFTLFWIAFTGYYRRKAEKGADEKIRTEAATNAKVLYIVSVCMAIFFGLMQCIFLFAAMQESVNNLTSAYIDIDAVVNILMGIFIIIIGNLIPKARPNSSFGVRTVWSMENDRTWAESNRLGGFIFVIAGVLTIIASVILGGLLSTFIMIGIIIAAAVASITCSYKAYKKFK